MQPVRRPSAARRRTAVIAAAFVALLAGLVPAAAAPSAPATTVPGRTVAAAPVIPTLVAVRAARHPRFDRIVFQFDTPTAPAATVAYVPQLIGEGSGLPVPVPGRAVINVRFTGAVAHDEDGHATIDTTRAFALPNIMSLRSGGDFEAVVNLGVGVARRTAFHVHRLANPGRVVVDVSSTFAWTWRRVYFMDSDNFATGQEPLVRGVLRPIPNAYPVKGLLDRLFAGPTNSEEARGLRFVSSQATGYANARVSTGLVARVRLTGGCDSGGSTFTIASEMFPTLKPLRTVRWVKIYDPAGTTERPTGRTDSIPACLEP